MNVLKSLLKNDLTYQELDDALFRPKAHISFWGKRYVTTIIKEGSVEIDSLVAILDNLVERNFEFSKQERDLGKKIELKIQKLYMQSDEALSKSFFLTRIFCFFREFSLEPTIRQIFFKAYSPFDLYTKSQWKNEKASLFSLRRHPPGHPVYRTPGEPLRYLA